MYFTYGWWLFSRGEGAASLQGGGGGGGRVPPPFPLNETLDGLCEGPELTGWGCRLEHVEGNRGAGHRWEIATLPNIVFKRGIYSPCGLGSKITLVVVS